MSDWTSFMVQTNLVAEKCNISMKFLMPLSTIFENIKEAAILRNTSYIWERGDVTCHIEIKNIVYLFCQDVFFQSAHEKKYKKHPVMNFSWIKRMPSVL